MGGVVIVVVVKTRFGSRGARLCWLIQRNSSEEREDTGGIGVLSGQREKEGRGERTYRTQRAIFAIFGRLRMFIVGRK